MDTDTVSKKAEGRSGPHPRQALPTSVQPSVVSRGGNVRVGIIGFWLFVRDFGGINGRQWFQDIKQDVDHYSMSAYVVAVEMFSERIPQGMS